MAKANIEDTDTPTLKRDSELAAPDSTKGYQRTFRNKTRGPADETEHARTSLDKRTAENAYLTGRTYDAGWAFSFGYSKADDKCESFVVPDNGYIGDHGDRWECHRGFGKLESECVAVNVPVNAFLDRTSDGGETIGELEEHHAPLLSATCVPDA